MEIFRSTSIDCIKKIAPFIQDLKDQTTSKASASTVSSTFLSDQRHITLNLDDAFQVLRSITKAPSSMSAKDIDALVNQKVNALLSSHKASNKQVPNAFYLKVQAHVGWWCSFNLVQRQESSPPRELLTKMH